MRAAAPLRPWSRPAPRFLLRLRLFFPGPTRSQERPRPPGQARRRSPWQAPPRARTSPVPAPRASAPAAPASGFPLLASCSRLPARTLLSAPCLVSLRHRPGPRAPAVPGSPRVPQAKSSQPCSALSGSPVASRPGRVTYQKPQIMVPTARTRSLARVAFHSPALLRRLTPAQEHPGFWTYPRRSLQLHPKSNVHRIRDSHDPLYNLFGPVKNENVATFILKRLKVFKSRHQRIKPSLGHFKVRSPAVTPGSTMSQPKNFSPALGQIYGFFFWILDQK